MADDKTVSQVAQEGYAIWRGAFRGEFAPCHWDDLNDRQKSSYKAVAAYAAAQSVGAADDHETPRS